MYRSHLTLNPVSDFRSMEEMLERLFSTPTRQSGVSSLPVDLTEVDRTLIVRANVPGLTPEEVEVAVENGVLTIRGEFKLEANGENEKVYVRETGYGRFARSLRLPENANLEAIEAKFKNGVLTVSIPRLAEEKPKALKINVRSEDAA